MGDSDDDCSRPLLYGNNLSHINATPNVQNYRQRKHISTKLSQQPGTDFSGTLNYLGQMSYRAVNDFKCYMNPKDYDYSTVSEEFSESRESSFTIVDEDPRMMEAVNGSDFLSSKYESLDYDVMENELYYEGERSHGSLQHLYVSLVRWLLMLAIGCAVGLFAVALDLTMTHLAEGKYELIKNTITNCLDYGCTSWAFLMWITIDCSLILFAASLAVIFCPAACGSGVPEIKCYLNGVKIPDVVRLKTLIVKSIGVICVVVGGLAGGREGPMIHIGSIIAAGISQGRANSVRFDILRCCPRLAKVFENFRNDKEKRDFVSAGAAAGVSAAFGAPIGGVLFSLEEGASFWNQALTWRIFFASMSSAFVVTVILSAINDHLGAVTYQGLVNFGQFPYENCHIDTYDIFTVIILGVMGGLLGALFNSLSFRLTLFRRKYLNRLKACRIIEAMIVSLVSTTISFSAVYFFSDCHSLRTYEESKYAEHHPVQLFCTDGEYNALATLIFTTPEESIKKLFHNPKLAYSCFHLLFFFLVYFLLTCWVFGLCVPAGLFVPALLTGATMGRSFGEGLHALFPQSEWVVPGKYAVIGSAAFLGGVSHMTLSLTVILIETTGNTSYGLLIMVTVMIAKWVGSLFQEGIYEANIKLKSIPLLPWEHPGTATNLQSKDVMASPVCTFQQIEQVGKIIAVLSHTNHNGFPVVDGRGSGNTHDDHFTYGQYRGFINRSQLIILLKHKVFFKDLRAPYRPPYLAMYYFKTEYPRFPCIDSIHTTVEEDSHFIDLQPYMNRATYTVTINASYPRLFRLFRALGLRHLVVVNEDNDVVGIVTRKDLGRFRESKRCGKPKLEHLDIR